jgi:signal transduction histidine kinase
MPPFVTKGFVRLRAEVIEGNVQLSVEDSGPEIPESTRKILFSRFQESLDSLNQGTGIELCLCKGLIGLMGDLHTF